MKKTIKVIKPARLLKGNITLPASKSISNRLLIMQALCDNNLHISNLSAADDTIILQKLLNKIGLSTVQASPVEIDCSNAGTNLRFLTAFLALKPGRWVLTGSERMKQRPVGELADSLKLLGASIEYLGNVGFPPLLIKGRPLKSCELNMNAGISSQFISAILMIAPYVSGGLTIHLKGNIISEPYIDMTVKLMKQCGIHVSKWKHQMRVEPGAYACAGMTVESDWSAASFWYEAAAMAEAVELSLHGLFRKSLQGDSLIADAFTVFGVQSEFRKPAVPAPQSAVKSHKSQVTSHKSQVSGHQSPVTVHLSKKPHHLDGFYYDFTHHPDLALPTIASCAALGLRGRFEGLQSLAIKESDRVRSVTTELKKIGCKVMLSPGDSSVIEILPSRLVLNPDAVIDTYRDHRMAMTFAMLALRTGSIIIADPDVVVKSYPGFWEDLESAGFQIK